jgi:iron complex transport system substrate-binding protein
MKKSARAFASVSLLIVVLACSREQPVSQTPQHRNTRIVSLAPSLTETLFALGVGDQIVAVTMHCTYPPAARLKENIGDFLHPNLEKILSLKPDLVIAEQWPSSKTVSRLRRLGLQVFEPPSPRSLEEIYEMIRLVGEVVGRTERAEHLIAEMRRRVELVRDGSRKLTRQPTVYVEIDLPSWTIGSQSFITEALDLCGARNLFADVQRRALQASKETIIARNPEIILSFTVSAEKMSQRPGWGQIKAVQKGRIIDDFDQSLLSHGNHRLIEAMEQLQSRFLETLDES